VEPERAAVVHHRNQGEDPTCGEAAYVALVMVAQVGTGVGTRTKLRGMGRGSCVIDLDRQVIKVSRGWDPTARLFIETVPISSRLTTLLSDHLVLMDHPSGLLFPGRDPSYPIHPSPLRRRVAKRWGDVGLEPLGFHEARHTYASINIAAGMNAKTLSTYMGHASIWITLDLYGHLLPRNEAEARDQLDAYLDAHDG
jgi:integrase